MLEGLYRNTEAARVAGDTCCVQNAHLQKLLGLSGLGRAPRSSFHRPQPFLVAPTAWSPPCSSCPCPHAHPILLAPAHLCISRHGEAFKTRVTSWAKGAAHTATAARSREAQQLRASCNHARQSSISSGEVPPLVQSPTHRGLGSGHLCTIQASSSPGCSLSPSTLLAFITARSTVSSRTM